MERTAIAHARKQSQVSITPRQSRRRYRQRVTKHTPLHPDFRALHQRRLLRSLLLQLLWRRLLRLLRLFRLRLLLLRRLPVLQIDRTSFHKAARTKAVQQPSKPGLTKLQQSPTARLKLTLQLGQGRSCRSRPTEAAAAATTKAAEVEAAAVAKLKTAVQLQCSCNSRQQAGAARQLHSLSSLQSHRAYASLQCRQHSSGGCREEDCTID